MKYSRFEELPVWNASIELALRVYKLTQDRAFVRQRSLRDQLEGAAVSISTISPKASSAAPHRSYSLFFTFPGVQPERCARCCV